MFFRRIFFLFLSLNIAVLPVFAQNNKQEQKNTPASNEQKEAEQEEVAPDEFPSHPGFDPAVYQQIKVFFLLIQRGKVDAAYDGLVRGTALEAKAAEVITLKDKTKQAIQLFGEIRGYEILELRKVGENLLNVVMLSLGEKYPLRWKLYFYHSRDTWRLIDIRVDDHLLQLFGEEYNSR